MNEVAIGLDALDVLLDEIVSSNYTSTPVSQIGQSEVDFVHLTNNSQIEVNLVEGPE